jgi:hypothetical protein
MSNGSAAECLVAYDSPNVEIEERERGLILRLKSIPWTRVAVDTLLVAAILLASSSFLTVR